MNILALDTTTPYGSVAVLEDDEVRGEFGVVSATTHSSRLLGSIDHLLAALELDLREIGGFAVATGPGSFTGLRIGLSTIKSFAFASGKPVAAVSSLTALAGKLRDSGGALVAPMIDAKKGEIYAAVFEFRRGRAVEVVPQGAYDPRDFVARLPGGRRILFLGNGLALGREMIIRRLKDRAFFPVRSLFIAGEVGRLGYEILKAGKGRGPEEIGPLYLRASQAEDKRSTGVS